MEYNSFVSALLLNMNEFHSIYSVKMSTVVFSVRKTTCIDLLLCLTLEKTWHVCGGDRGIICSIRDTRLLCGFQDQQRKRAWSETSTRLSEGSRLEEATPKLGPDLKEDMK